MLGLVTLGFSLLCLGALVYAVLMAFAIRWPFPPRWWKTSGPQSPPPQRGTEQGFPGRIFVLGLLISVDPDWVW